MNTFIKINLSRTIKSVYAYLTNFLSSKLFLSATVVLFIFQTVYIAVSTRYGIPPDESFHFDLIKLYTESGVSPFLQNQDGYYFLGEVVRTPFYLYHWLLSLPFHFVQNIENSYIFLRFINILIGLGSLFVLYKISNVLKLPALVRNVSLFMFCNTLMFVFLTSAISYDNLFILLSLLGMYYILLVREDFALKNVLILILIFCAGLLTKVTFIPVLLILGVMLAHQMYQKKVKLRKFVKLDFSEHRALNTLLVVMIACFIGLIIESYGYNIINYGSYKPSCTQVLELEQCQENGLFVRNSAIYEYDRRTAELSTFEYFFDWAFLTQSRTLGVHAHKQIDAFKPALLLLQALMAIWFVLLIRFFDNKDKAMIMVISFATLYALIVFIENNSIYNSVGRPSFAVHGRYLFPSLPLLYLFGNYFFINSIRSKLLKITYLMIVVVVFLVSSLPHYICRTSTEWQTKKFEQISVKLKSLRD